MSNAAALRIIAVSTDVLFNTMEDVFVTGICRAATGISCTSVSGIPRLEEPNEAITDCDVVSGRVMNVHYVLSAERMTRLWSLVGNSVATEREECRSDISTVYVVVISVTILFVAYCVSTYCRTLLSVLLQVGKSKNNLRAA